MRNSATAHRQNEHNNALSTKCRSALLLKILIDSQMRVNASTRFIENINLKHMHENAIKTINRKANARRRVTDAYQKYVSVYKVRYQVPRCTLMQSDSEAKAPCLQIPACICELGQDQR